MTIAEEELEQLEEQPRKRKRAKRDEIYDVIFVNDCCEGWAFDVCESFKLSLDIDYTWRVDKERTKAAKKLNKKAKSIYRRVWTRGAPPLLSFERGHVFYDPPGARAMSGTEMAKVLRRTVRVLEAVADGDQDRNGWVMFAVEHHEGSKVARRDMYRCSQAAFEVFLRSGEPPAE
jgi:hypothetical protein